MPSPASVRLNTMILAAIVPVTFFIGIGYSDGSGSAFTYSAVNAVLLLPLVGLALAIAEVTVQATVARLLGDRLHTVTFGLGPEVISRCVRRLNVGLRALPMYSSTAIITPKRKGQRLRLGAAHLMGTAAVGTAAALILANSSWSTLRLQLSTGLAPEALVLVVAAVTTYFGVFTDIGILTGLPGFSHATEANLAARRNLFWFDAALHHLERGAYAEADAMAKRGLAETPDDALLQFIHVSVASSTSSPDAFELARALAAREVPPSLRHGCLNLWAWECYMRGDQTFAAEADRASAEALALLPKNPALLDTRGHVLLWLGRSTEAQPLLERAYELARHKSTYAHSAAGLAMLCASTDRHDEAVTWLARAREHDPDNRLLPRATAMIEPLRRT